MLRALLVLLALTAALAMAMAAPTNESSTVNNSTMETNTTTKTMEDLNDKYKLYQDYDTYSSFFITYGIWIMRAFFSIIVIFLIVKYICELVNEWRQRREARTAAARNPNGRVRAEYIPIVLIRDHRDRRAIDAETC